MPANGIADSAMARLSGTLISPLGAAEVAVASMNPNPKTPCLHAHVNGLLRDGRFAEAHTGSSHFKTIESIWLGNTGPRACQRSKTVGNSGYGYRIFTALMALH